MQTVEEDSKDLLPQFGRQEIFDILVWVRIHRALAAQDFSIIQQKV